MEIIDDGSCFVCGDRNDAGLKLSFELSRSARSARTSTVLAEHFSGWPKAAHGGIVAALLDEAQVYACAAAGKYVATGTLNIRYRRPVPTGKTLEVSGEVIRAGGRAMSARSRIECEGELLAEAEGRLVVMEDTGELPNHRFVD